MARLKDRIQLWFWKAANFIDGKKTYIASGIQILVSAYIAYRSKQAVNWEAVATLIMGLVIFFFRAIARKQGFLVGEKT